MKSFKKIYQKLDFYQRMKRRPVIERSRAFRSYLKKLKLPNALWERVEIFTMSRRLLVWLMWKLSSKSFKRLILPTYKNAIWIKNFSLSVLLPFRYLRSYDFSLKSMSYGRLLKFGTSKEYPEMTSVGQIQSNMRFVVLTPKKTLIQCGKVLIDHANFRL